MAQGQRMPKYELPYNPWRVLDMQRARAADPWSYAQEKRMIMMEYKNCPEPELCQTEGCKTNGRPSKMFWRNTVGVLMCPNCRLMKVHTPEGVKYITGSGYTPEWSA